MKRTPKPSRVAPKGVRVTLLHLTHLNQATAVAVSASITKFATAEDVALLALAEIESVGPKAAGWSRRVLPGIGEVVLGYDRGSRLPLIGVVEVDEYEAWDLGVRHVTKAKVIDTLWFTTRAAGRGGDQ